MGSRRAAPAVRSPSGVARPLPLSRFKSAALQGSGFLGSVALEASLALTRAWCLSAASALAMGGVEAALSTDYSVLGE